MKEGPNFLIKIQDSMLYWSGSEEILNRVKQDILNLKQSINDKNHRVALEEILTYVE
ncbi:MAG: hypothetical protein HeimAB125_21120 [Candidatus Heimdallarchaeota archaeon AB_125]|nr:MAG: hypothetical protein HeimAB125_21120 [Candidatus Heimdallarchaeota archaeon AB_125]